MLELYNKLDKLNSKREKEKMVWMWIKQDHISFSTYMLLRNHID